MPNRTRFRRSNPRFSFSRFVRVRTNGSEQESVKLCVFRDFLEFAKLDCRRRRRCGNVETRVLWGFPSSVSGAGIRLGKEDRPARGASFPQRTSIFRGLARLCPFSTRSRSRTASPEKPRSVRVFTDSRSEPKAVHDWPPCARSRGQPRNRAVL